MQTFGDNQEFLDYNVIFVAFHAILLFVSIDSTSSLIVFLTASQQKRQFPLID